ncbi:helix-turn-helix domain-containing protein [Sphingosinicella sp.]|uniref:helix-turn-helix domain-containing protein n=1 Tax=Sphingosinicella sp. TaxID=1917971 RepID=UPI0017E9C353|nr:helix-turn-helix domain-containing protein [Sphingosinicella sp.]MBA4758855.1 helix-turn-helix domain-containing protein [Sphingosinicella sp.]
MSDRIAYSVKEVEQRFGLGTTTVYKLIKEGRLETFRVGRRRLITAQSAHNLVTEAA